MSRSIVPLLLLAFLAAAASAAAEPPEQVLRPRATFPKPAHTRVGPEHVPGLITLKLAEGNVARLRGGELVSPSGDARTAARFEEVNRILEAASPLALTRLFSRPEGVLDEERRRAELLSGWELADLNLYYSLVLPQDADIARTIDALNALPIVEIAYPVARPAPAVWLPGGKIPESSDLPSSPAILDAPLAPTPDFTGMQDYLESAPVGIEAWHAWGVEGGDGEGVKVIDIEWGWNFDHEDFKPFFFIGNNPDTVDHDHGTAVVGEMIGQPNGYGVTGICHAAEIGVAAVEQAFPNAADVYNLAAANLSPGDLFLIEMHMPGPNWDGETQFGYVPMEWNQDNFDAIQHATAGGIIVVEAAGNGSQNLDDPIYENKFDRNLRDSGAIMAGAGKPYNLWAEPWSNNGNRLDLHGWGEAIVTTGYGDLQGGDPDQWYTDGFSGTSGASPIVTGAVASLQGVYRAARGGVLGPLEARRILADTGSPQGLGGRIGPRPDLARAIDTLLTHTGTIVGTVSDSLPGLPLPGARVEIVEPVFWTHTDSDGSYGLIAYEGLWTVITSALGHASDTALVSVVAGQFTTHDVVLSRSPWGILEGTVADIFGRRLEGATVTVPGIPGAAASSDSSGYYVIPWLPAGETYEVEVSRAGYASRSDSVTIEEGTIHILDFYLPLYEGFEDDDGGYVGAGEWEWGEPTLGGGPPAAFDGLKCWGTDLDGKYDQGVDYSLYSAPISLVEWSSATLNLHHWIHTILNRAGGNIQVSADAGSTWTVVVPEGSYHTDSLEALDGEPGFTGPHTFEGWTPVVVDLADYLGSEITLRFRFASGSGFPAPGWYVDGLYVDGALRTDVGGPSAEPVTRQVPLMLIPLRPNPTGGKTTITFELAASQEIDLAVYDVSGRRLTSLAQGRREPGSHRVSWSGLDDRGRAVAPGVYFVRLAGRERSEVRRLVLVR